MLIVLIIVKPWTNLLPVILYIVKSGLEVSLHHCYQMLDEAHYLWTVYDLIHVHSLALAILLQILLES